MTFFLWVLSHYPSIPIISGENNWLKIKTNKKYNSCGDPDTTLMRGVTWNLIISSSIWCSLVNWEAVNSNLALQNGGKNKMPWQVLVFSGSSIGRSANYTSLILVMEGVTATKLYLRMANREPQMRKRGKVATQKQLCNKDIYSLQPPTDT